MIPHSTLGALPCFLAFFWNRAQLMCIRLCALAFLLVSSALDAQPANLSQRVEELGSENARIRRDAAMYLSQMAASGQDMQDALPALIEALGDREEQVWFHTVTALATMGPSATAAAPELLKALKNFNARGVNVRWYRSVHALSQMGEGVLDRLIAACEDENANLRAGAAQALGGIDRGSERSVPVLIQLMEDESDLVREAVIKSLSLLPSPARTSLLEALSHPSALARQAACQALGKMGHDAKDAADKLFALLSMESDQAVLGAALECLPSIDAPSHEVLQAVMSYFATEQEDLRQAVSNVLLKLPPSLVVPALLHQLEHADQASRDRSVDLLAYLGSDAKPALPLLMHLIQTNLDQPEQLQPYRKAFLQVGNAGIPMVVEAMQTALGDSHQKTLDEMLTAYGLVAVQPILDMLPSQSESMQSRMIRSLSGIGKNARLAQGAMLEAARSKHPMIRAAAIEALASMEIKMETFHQVVTPLLQDDFLEVRLSAVMALAQLPSAVQKHLEALGALIIDPDTVLREQALMALTHAGDGASVYQDQVAVLLADPSTGVRHAAMRVLGAMGETTPMAIAQITWLGQTGGQETLRHALDALGRMGEQAESALPLLRQSLQHEEASIRLSAFEGLMAVETGSEKRLPVMLKALEDRSTPMRHASMKALISLKEEAAPAIPVLIQRLSESEDRELALGALRVVPSQMTYLELYLQALGHDDPGVRAFGCRALGNLGAAAEKALPELRNMRRDRYRFVREQASEAIKQIEG